MEHGEPLVNPFYEKYKDYGILPSAVPAVSALIIINTTGIIANTLVIIITAASKHLRSTTNYLLAIQCFFDSVHLLAHYYLGYAVYSGKNFDTLSDCFKIMIAPLIGYIVGTQLVFFTAFDRLIVTLFPLKYQRMNKLLYLASIMCICMAYSSYIIYLGYLNAREHKEAMVICLIIEGIHGTPSTILAYTVFGLIFGGIFIYLVIGIFIHYKGNSSSTTKKLFKSLLILCVIMVCSWAFTTVTVILCGIFGLSEEIIFFVPLYLGITINIACASNFFVLTRYSSEYRTATREFFNRFGITTFFQPIAGNSRIFGKTTIHKPIASVMPKETMQFRARKTITNVTN